VLASLGLADPRTARVVHIADTLSLVCLEVSEAFREEAERRADLTSLSGLSDMQFDATGNLATPL
jgi:hypothetical protein